MKITEDFILDKLNSIQNREDFIIFFQLFQQYFIENKDNLENTSIESFLEAMGAFVKSSDNYYKNFNIDVTKLSSWRIFADILMAATTYE